MSPSRASRARRLLADLGSATTRPTAMSRIRRSAGGWVAGSAASRHQSRATRKAAAPGDPEQARAARLHRAQASFAEALGAGSSLPVATCRAVAELAAVREFSAAWALAEAVRRMPDGDAAGTAADAVLLHRRGQFRRGWERVRGLDDGILRQALPVEAVDAALSVGTPESRDRALRLVADPAAFSGPQLVDLAGRLLAMDERPAARALLAELSTRPSAELDERRAHVVRRIERWLANREVEPPEGSVVVGLLGYGSPDPAAPPADLDDWVAGLALLGNLVRFAGVAFTGEQGLGEVATELQGCVAARFALPGVANRVHLVPVDRDASSLGDIPENTWTVAFGWHQHALFGLRHDFPYHRNVRPLFVSFHVGRLDLLDDEALAYLRSHGPVGCRDWTTVNLLLSAGVDAFFTGCLSSTVDTLFPSRADAYGGGGRVGVVEPPAGVADGAEALRAAHARLGRHQRDLDRAATNRLSAYLPLTSLGVPVDFRPANPGEARLAGLTGLSPDSAALDAMRDGIRQLLAAVFTTILGGAGPDEVRARWRELTADRVAEAKRRCAEPLDATEPSLDVEALAATALAAAHRFGPHESVDPGGVVDLVLAYDANLTWPAAVFLQSVLDHVSGPVRLWVLTRGIGPSYGEWLAAAFPQVAMTFLPCDDISYDADAGPARRFPGRITVSTMDRILLPLLLPDVHRVLYLDVDTVVLDDITDLFRTDLEGHPVAVRDSNIAEASEWVAAGRRLPEAEALALRGWMGREHPFGGRAINAGVLVMDLDRMRADDFTARYLALGARFGLHDQDTMLMYLGPDRVHLPARWNALPVHEDVPDPAVIHWASLGKPWDAELTVHQHLWRAVADRLEERVGRPPA